MYLPKCTTHKDDYEFHNLYFPLLLMLHTEFGQQNVQQMYKTEEYSKHASIKYCLKYVNLCEQSDT